MSDESGLDLTQPMFPDEPDLVGNSHWRPILLTQRVKPVKRSRERDYTVQLEVEVLEDMGKCLEDLEDRIESLRKRIKLRVKTITKIKTKQDREN